MQAWSVILAALSVCLVAGLIGRKYWRRRCPSCGRWRPINTGDSRAFGPPRTVKLLHGTSIRQPFEVEYRCRKCDHEWWLVE